MYRIGVISDTHGLLRSEVKETLKSCDLILHSGDINRQDLLDELGTIAPTIAVRGNNDGEWACSLPQTRAFTLQGIHFYMIHNKKQIRENLDVQNIIIYGHSHKYEEIKKDGQLWLNPGSCGARRFRLPITFALIEIDSQNHYSVRKIELPPDARFPAGGKQYTELTNSSSQTDRLKLIQTIMRETDRGVSTERISQKHRIPAELTEQICRLYLTHPGVDADGILNKMS